MTKVQKFQVFIVIAVMIAAQIACSGDCTDGNCPSGNYRGQFGDAIGIADKLQQAQDYAAGE